MRYDRRKFIRTAGAGTAAALILPQWACNNENKTTADGAAAANAAVQGSIPEFGIQLYTLRDVLPDDPKGTLKQLADMGYQQIESYEGKQGMFWGMGNTGFKSYLDDLGMSIVASHCNIHEDFEEKAGQAAEIGMKYLVCPYVGPQKSIDDWKKITDRFNECGAICQKNGIRFAYHNHEYTFVAFSGMIPHHFIMENTDPALVDHEMDIYWVVTGGADPVEFLTQYPNRFRLCHVKDRLKTATAEEREASCDLGTGSIDFPAILKVAAENGMQYFLVEQERYDNSTPLQSAKADAEYLKNLVFA